MKEKEIYKIFNRVFKIYTYKDIQEIIESIIDTLVFASEERDPYTAGHQKRVAKLSYAIGTKLDLDDEQVENLYLASLVHDIGKISIPAELLMKPRKLTDIEMALVKHHPIASFQILSRIKYFKDIPQIALEHHERLDGSGYPNGIKGKDIRIEARILTVADVVEAMLNIRPYRAALGIDAALHEINEHKDEYYDPKIVDVCTDILTKGFAFH